MTATAPHTPLGGTTESSAWRCECGDLNRPHEAFCYRCGAGPHGPDCTVEDGCVC